MKKIVILFGRKLASFNFSCTFAGENGSSGGRN